MLLRLGNINLSQMNTINVILFHFYSFMEISCSSNKNVDNKFSNLHSKDWWLHLDVISDKLFFTMYDSFRLLDKYTFRKANTKVCQRLTIYN